MSVKKKKVINGYELFETLGEDSYGKVHKAVEIKTGKEVAIKSINVEIAERRKIAEKEEGNYQLLKGSSPYLINLLDSFEEDDVKYFVLELCENSNLNSVVELFKKLGVFLHEENIWKILSQFLLALGTLESFNMIHHDIKGENVFINKDNSLKLGNFGLSHKLSFESEKASTLVGTMEFMSPEVISGKPYNASSDIWSTGVVMYQLIELQLPFDGVNVVELQKAIATKPHPPLKKRCSAALQGVVNRMLEKDPSKRITLRELLLLPEVRRSITENALVVPPFYQKLYDSTPMREESELVLGGFGDVNKSAVEEQIKITFIPDEENGGQVEGRKIKFTKNYYACTVFMNERLSSGIVKMEVLCLAETNDGHFRIGIASQSKMEILKTDYFNNHNSTCCILGEDRVSWIEVGKSKSFKTGISLPTTTRITLELNADVGTLDFFVNGKQIPHRVKGIPKDVYFGFYSYYISRSYEVLSLLRLSQPTSRNDLVTSEESWVE